MTKSMSQKDVVGRAEVTACSEVIDFLRLYGLALKVLPAPRSRVKRSAKKVRGSAGQVKAVSSGEL